MASTRPLRRNPEILGVDYGHAFALLGGAWFAKNAGALLKQNLPMLAAPLDRIRPGLGLAAFEALSAPVAARVAHMVRPSAAQYATLGAAAIAGNDALNALVGNVNLIAGSPNLTGFAPKVLPPATSSNSAGALPAPSLGGMPAPGGLTPVALLGTGTVGF